MDIDLSDFYYCFLKQSTPPQGQIDSSLLGNKIRSWKKGNPPSKIKQDIANILNSNITTCEIIHALKKLKKSKSPGIDSISLKFIKSDMITFLPLLKSFNNILNTGITRINGSKGQSLQFIKVEVNHAQKTIGELVLCQPAIKK